MLVYTKTKILLSSLLVLSVAANVWFMYAYWVDVSPANRAKFAYLFPGIEVDKIAGYDTEQLLRFSYVFVDDTDTGGFELVVADRRSCSHVSFLSLAKEQPLDPALLVEKPIWIEDFSLTEQGLTLRSVREDSFAVAHLDDLKKACPFLAGKVFD